MYEVVIIGAGPAGISMAAEAINKGISRDKILVLEKMKEHSFSIRKFYPEQKLVTANYKGHAAVCKGVMCIADSSKSDTLSYLDKMIEDYKIPVSYEQTVYKIHKNEDETFHIFSNDIEIHCRTCVIAIGMMGKPNKPDYRIPSEIRDNVTYDITSKKIENKKVLVVGGGDSASEYVQYLNQEGNKVTLSYRRDNFARMNTINQESLKALEERKEVNIYLNSNISEIGESNGNVVVNFDSGTEEFEHVVYALGGSTPKNFLSLLGIEFNGNDPVLTEGYETSIPGLFLIGDLGAGRKGGSIITAFNSAHEAMSKMCDDYLECKL
ncbi:MAG: NAD(P)-binding domain-containing protein [Oligoflexia bacterium]|nr:NAD(P)-binding domain-containing protein [Oligoflexia bacterium]